MPTPPTPPVSGTINGVDVTVMIDGGVTEQVTPTGFEATVVFKCAYERRFDLIEGLKGTSKWIGGAPVRVKPFRYPPLPGLICTSISDIRGIKPRRDAIGWLVYKYAVLTCHFSFLPWGIDGTFDPAGQADPSGKPYTTTTFNASAEVFTPPGGSFYWVYNGQPVEESALGLIRPRIEISMTRHFLPYVPLDEIMKFQGNVNDTPVTFSNHTFPRGCLMFGNARSTPTTDGGVNLTHEIEYLLLGNYNVEWNALMGRDGAWHLINTAPGGGGNPPFPYVDYLAFLP